MDIGLLSVAAVLYVTLLGFIWQSHFVLSRRIDASVTEMRNEIRAAITELRGEIRTATSALREELRGEFRAATAQVRDDIRMHRKESQRSHEAIDERLRRVEQVTAGLTGRPAARVTDT